MFGIGWSRRLIAICFVAVTAVGWGTSADASLTYETGRGNDGTGFVVVSGAFEPNDDLSRFVSTVQSGNVKAVFFNSPGGNVGKALELGRLILSLRLVTFQVRTSECASACSLAFMGGVLRFAEPGSIGVHRSSFSDTSGLNVTDAVSEVQRITAQVIAYMTEMGVDPGLLQLSLNYDSNDIRYLSGSEMKQYRLALNPSDSATDAASAPVTPSPAPPPALPPAPAVASLPPTPEPQPSFAIPDAKTGRIQSYDGKAALKVGPTSKSPTVESFMNGSPVTILDDTGKWYHAKVGTRVGYLFHSWVWVTQFGAGPYGKQFVQVKSFNNYAETEQYVRSSPLPVTAYLASNGWFAITLNRTFDPDAAAKTVDQLKASGSIPDDSIATWGNAFVRKVL
ncbi:hypothetical protein AB4Z52_32330 [Rhizobium sp. 2YAF20]|uniref:SH3 domain-containing protein n=1 Tax=Rhizobium sp. 2YAF20 TaxID=3233027 RepID=UPI003F998E63